MPNWGQVLGEINHVKIEQDALIKKAEQNKRAAVDTIRRKYLDTLFKYTGRNVIAYYSGWLSKPGVVNQDIIDEDKIFSPASSGAALAVATFFCLA